MQCLYRSPRRTLQLLHRCHHQLSDVEKTGQQLYAGWEAVQAEVAEALVSLVTVQDLKSLFLQYACEQHQVSADQKARVGRLKVTEAALLIFAAEVTSVRTRNLHRAQYQSQLVEVAV